MASIRPDVSSPRTPGDSSSLGAACIEVQLHDLAQLFNSMDPSPFFDKDLDSDAEEFIVSWSQEIPKGRELELLIHLLTPPKHGRGSSDVEGAVQHYFANRSEIKRREFRLLMRRARVVLLVGILFLASCLLLGQLLSRLRPGALADVARESLTIAGWVAMWRPIQIYLYDWWPLREDLHNLERLARMRVCITIDGAEAARPASR
jgi:hypothetical protein